MIHAAAERVQLPVFGRVAVGGVPALRGIGGHPAHHRGPRGAGRVTVPRHRARGADSIRVLCVGMRTAKPFAAAATGGARTSTTAPEPNARNATIVPGSACPACFGRAARTCRAVHAPKGPAPTQKPVRLFGSVNFSSCRHGPDVIVGQSGAKRRNRDCAAGSLTCMTHDPVSGSRQDRISASRI